MDLQKFDFNGKKVRILQDQHGEPWFVAKDVAEVLGYRDGPNMTRHIDPEDLSTHILSRNHRGNPNVKVINESGLYTAIFHSRRPDAKKFKRHVTSEILPSIRKHGGYVQGQEELTDEELMAKALLMAQSKIEEKQAVIEAQRDQLIEAAPKVEHFEEYMESHNAQTFEDVAKNMGVSGTTLCRWLRDDRILFKRKDKNRAMQKYMDAGWFVEQVFIVKGKSYSQVRVTPYGAFKIQQRYKSRKRWDRPHQRDLVEN